MNFFKPSDIKQIVCTISNMTKGGSAFAVTEASEQVYISPKIVEAVNVDVGDMMLAHCIDNFRSDAEGRYSARWRAIRVEVTERLDLTSKPVVQEPQPVVLGALDLSSRCRGLMDLNRAWTAAQMAKEIGVETLRTSNWLQYQHTTGAVASARIYANGEQERASKVYYARDVDLLEELIDEVTLD
jgi:hypothetical protein